MSARRALERRVERRVATRREWRALQRAGRIEARTGQPYPDSLLSGLVISAAFRDFAQAYLALPPVKALLHVMAKIAAVTAKAERA